MMINKLPTSKYGTTLVKRCKWCYNVIHIEPKQDRKDKESIMRDKGKSSLIQAVWCSKDCKEEEMDYNFLNARRKTLELLHKKYQEKKKQKVAQLLREYKILNKI